jgi:hypothetical protein
MAGEGRGERAFNTLARLAVVDVEAAATEEESTATFAIFEFKANKFAHFYYRLLMKKVRKTLRRTADIPFAQGSFLLRRPAGCI